MTTNVQWNKLVRDRIPEIIERDGKIAITRTLDTDEYIAALKTKLIEEAQEVQDASPDSLEVELADVLEVVYSLAMACKSPWDAIETTRRNRATVRGTFNERTFLIETREPA